MTRDAPVKVVSLVMDVSFVASFVANLAGGLVSAQIEVIECGDRAA